MEQKNIISIHKNIRLFLEKTPSRIALNDEMCSVDKIDVEIINLDVNSKQKKQLLNIHKSQTVITKSCYERNVKRLNRNYF